MTRGRMRLAGAAAALSLALLTGCSGIPSEVSTVFSDVATVVGEVFEPLSDLIDEAIGDTSVAEARQQRVDDLLQLVSDSDLVTAGTLTVGIKVSETTPLAISDTDDSYSGIDVDVAYALADALGIANVEFVSVTSASSSLGEDCDIVMGVEEDEDDGVTVVGDYAQSALAVFTADELVSAPISESDLVGATVGVQGSSVSQVALRNLGVDVTEETFTNLNEAFEALADGTVDYVICDAYAGAYLASITGSGTFAGTIDTPSALGVGVLSTSTALLESVEQAMEEILSNGVATIAKSRWVGEFPTLTESSQIELTTESTDETTETSTADEATETDTTEG